MENHKKIYANLALLIAAWVLVYFDTIASMVELWSKSETYKHGFIILPIVIYLLYENRASIATAKIKPNYLLLVPLIITQLVFILAQISYINLISHLAAYASFVLIVWMILGNQFVKKAMFPLFYLVFTVPFGEELVPKLQQITADLSVVFINLAQVPVYRDGLYLHIPNGSFFVAEACAGIRFLIATIAIGSLFAYTFYQDSKKRVLFILCCIAIPILANGIRAAGIVIIGHYSNMEHAVGADHLVYGWFFFAFILALLFFIGQIWQEPTPPATKAKPQLAVADVNPASILIATGLLVASFGYVKHITQQDAQLAKQSPFITLESQQYTTSTPLWQPKFASADSQTTVVDQGGNTFVHLAQYWFETPEKELISWNNKFYNYDGFSIERSRLLTVKRQDFTVQLQMLTLTNTSGQKSTLVTFYKVGEKYLFSPLKVKLWQLWHKVINGDNSAVAIQVYFAESQTEESVISYIQQADWLAQQAPNE